MSDPQSKSMFGSHGASNGCVMLVEDEQAVREAMEAQLQETGYSVIGVESGEKAIEAIHMGENPFAVDVIIADVDKPACMDAVNYFKQQFSTIPLIGLTGLSAQEPESVPHTRIVILGAGKGGLSLLELLGTLPEVVVLGIADKDSNALAFPLARKLGIPVVEDPIDLIENDQANLIIDVTGDPEMGWSIAEYRMPGVEVLGGAAAKLLWDVAQHEAKMQQQIFQTEKMTHMVKNGVFANYLVKPVQPESLVETIARAMESREYHRAL
ncbi:MAG: response regulator [Nitrospirales bacterium]